MDLLNFKDYDLLIVTIIGAFLTFVINSYLQIRTAKQNAALQRAEIKRAQTFQLLSRIFEPGPVGDARLEMARWVAIDKVIDHDNLDPKDDKVILSIIDFYEFVCEGALVGKTVDLDLLNQESGGRIQRYYLLLEDYVEKREKKLGTPLYLNIKRFLRELKNVDVK